MKKTFIWVLFPIILIGASCKKTTTTNNVRPDISQLTLQINKLALAYKSDLPVNTAAKIDYNKAGKLALADGVGAAVGASGGPWGFLWGGFLTTLSLEPYFRGKVIASGTGGNTHSSLFDMAVAGDAHNYLMNESIVNGYLTTLDEDGTLNDELQGVLESTPFSGMSQGGLTLAQLYASTSSIILPPTTYAPTVFEQQGTEGLHDLLEHYVSNTNVVETVEAVIDAVDKNDIDDLADYTEFLDSVEELVKSSSFTTAEKDAIKAFLAIANSSYYYWSVTYNE